MFLIFFSTGFVQKMTGYHLWQLVLFFVAFVLVFALIFNIACGESKWFKDCMFYIKNEVPVYCCGYTSRPLDKLHYDPQIHDIHQCMI